MIGAVVALLIAGAIGFLLIRLVAPVRIAGPRWAVGMFQACAGAGIGAGLTSVLQYVLLRADGGRWMLMASEAVLLMLLAALALWRRSASPGPVAEDVPAFRWNVLLGTAAAAGLAFHLLSLAAAIGANPWGDWDAWCIWNVRAKYLAGGGDSWKTAASALIGESQPTYPLLLPALVARCWRYGGTVSEAAPAAVSVWFLGSLIGLLASALALLRGLSAGLLAALVLLATNTFLYQGHRLYADLPLAFFMLGALAFLLLAGQEQGAPWRPRVLAGACASFAAWTKGEGLVFAALFLGVEAAVRWRSSGWKASRKMGLAVLAGAAPVLLLTLHFQFAVAPPGNPFLSGSAGEAAARLLSIDRYAQTGAAFLRQAWTLGEAPAHPLLLLGILAAVLGVAPAPHHREWTKSASLTLALMLATYFGLYLVTTLPLDWLLGTSVDRLYAQVWPSAILLAFVVLRRPEDAAALAITSPRALKAARKEKSRRG
jgi:hypothetical protein